MLKRTVETAIEDLRMAFAPSALSIVEDGQGGAHVIVERTNLGEPYVQTDTWIGGHLTPFFPNSDIYPLFVRGDLARLDGKPLVAPVTPGHTYQSRAAVQISRRSPARDPQRETAVMKYMKVMNYLLSL